VQACERELVVNTLAAIARGELVLGTQAIRRSC
jgi:hypothetical protein